MAVTCMIGGNEAGDTLALEFGLALARRLNAPLRALAALPDAGTALIYATSPYMIGVGGAAVDQVRKAQDQLVAGWREMYDKVVAAAGEGVDAQFEHYEALTEQAAARAATLSEALVFPRAAGGSGHTLSSAFEHVMMNARLPMVLAGTRNQPDGPVMVAWDGSDEAARSVRFHLPLIRSADRVIIAQNPTDIGGDMLQPPADAASLATWLSRQGIASETQTFDGPVGQSLLELSETHGISTLIAGAYGHSRAGEFLFGGATRTLTHADAAPALALCH